MHKILTLHPDGKNGVNIDKDKYDMVKAALLKSLAPGPLTLKELFIQMEKNIEKNFDGKIGWYTMSLKLDLEARNIIERTNDKPQKIRII